MPKTRPITAWARSAGAVRWAKGLRRMTRKAALDWAPPSSREKPTMERTFSTWGQAAQGGFERGDNLARALDRGGVRELDGNEEGTLVFFGEEAGGGQLGEAEDAEAGGGDQDDAKDRHAQQAADDGGVSVAHPVDAAQDAAHDAPVLVGVAQEDAAQGGREGERVDGGDHHGDADGDGELAEQLAGDAGDEGDGYEDREQHQGDGDDRAGDLAHRLLGGFLWREVGLLLHHALDVLDHHDGVVDHDADGQDEGEQGDGVGGIAEHEQGGDGADDADRDGGGGDQGGADIAEEDEDHQHHEGEGFEQGLEDLGDGVSDEGGAVVEDDLLHARREALFQRVQGLVDAGGDFHRIGAGGEVDADGDGGLAVEAAFGVLGGRAEFDARDIADAQDRAVRVGAHDDVGEFLGRGAPAAGLQVHLDGVAVDRRLGADAPDGALDVLRLQGGDDVGRGQAEIDQAGGLEPDAHRIVECAEHERLSDAGDAGDGVDDVDGDVVGDEERGQGGVFGVELDEFQDGGAALGDGDALALDLGGHARQGGLDAVVDVDGVDVRVGAEVEADGQGIAAVIGAVGFHVQHLVDAVDGGFERLGDGGFDNGGGGAGEARADLDLGRDDVRELGDREAGPGDQAGQGGDDGNDDGQARTVDEDGREHGVSRAVQR